MIKVLFVNPPQKHLDAWSEYIEEASASNMPPLGLAYMAAVLEKEGDDVRIYDGQIQNVIHFRELNHILNQFKPDLIGITATTPTFHRAVSAAKNIKEIYPSIPIVLGGAHAISLPREILRKHKEFDIIVTGEGEYTMLDISKYVCGKKKLEDIEGIAYRSSNGELKLNKPRPYIKNLDELPFPARHLLPDLKKYKYVTFKRFPITHLTSGRGCPFDCIFCDHPFGKINRVHSPGYVIREIEHLVNDYGMKEITFFDENLMFNKNRLHKICDMIIEKNIDITWWCQGRVDRNDLELFKKMKKAGCWMISFGIESGDQNVLNFIKKGITLEKVRDAVKACKKAGLEARGSFMIGHPIDTKETVMSTIRFAKSLKLDRAGFSITVPYPGSELYNIADKYGKFEREDYSRFKKQPGQKLSFVPFGFTEKELLDLHKKARVEFYIKSTYLFRALKGIKNFKIFRRYFLGFSSIVLGDLLKIKK